MRLFFLLASLLCLSASPAAGFRHTKYQMPGGRYLELMVPTEWVRMIETGEDEGWPVIRFVPRNDPDTKVLLYPQQESHVRQISPAANARIAVAAMIEEVAAAAIEPDLVPLPIEGTDGYYFSATDREPAPGDFKYLTRGALPLSGVFLEFVILTNERDATVDDAMRMITGARYDGRDAVRELRERE